MQPSPVRANDPLGYLEPMPIEGEYFPMGFPLWVATNSQPALAAATHLWSRFPKLYEAPATRIKISVSGDATGKPEFTPVLRGQEHLFSIVGDSANFATADLDSGFAHLCITQAVASDAAYLRYHFLEPLAYALIAARHIAFVHASCVAKNGRAIVLCGRSGAGKTCLAYACARRGWTFISGDAVAVLAGRDDRRITGRPFEIRFRHTAQRVFPELAKFPCVLRPNGKTDIEVDPHDLNLPTAIASTASQIVFLNRMRHSAPPAVLPMSPAETRIELEEGICFGDTAVRARQSRTLDRFAETPAVRLRYSDLGEAEKALSDLIEGRR